MVRTSGKPYRVCLVLAALGIGGTELQLAAYLAHRPADLDVTVLYFSREHDQGPDSMLSRFQSLGLPVVYFPLQRATPGRVWALRRYFRETKPDMVHTILVGAPGTWGRLAAWLAGVPFVVHSDRALNPPVSTPHRLIRPWLDRVTDRFLPNAQAIAGWLASLGVSPDRVSVIPNGVDTRRFTPRDGAAARAQWGIPAAAVVAGFLGKFRPEKRLDLLLHAVRALPMEQRPDWLVLGGDGPLMRAVQEQVDADPWLRAHCRIVGLVDDTPAFLAGIDYLVLTSDLEGRPNVVLEAMTMGRPIVSTRVSDVPEMIADVGFLAEPGNAASIAKAIAAMQALAPAVRQAMGAMARERVLAQWDLEQVARQFWAAHLEVLS